MEDLQMAYVFQEYPKWVTHPISGEQKIVHGTHEESEFLEGFYPPAPSEPTPASINQEPVDVPATETKTDLDSLLDSPEVPKGQTNK